MNKRYDSMLLFLTPDSFKSNISDLLCQMSYNTDFYKLRFTGYPRILASLVNRERRWSVDMRWKNKHELNIKSRVHKNSHLYYQYYLLSLVMKMVGSKNELHSLRELKFFGKIFRINNKYFFSTLLALLEYNQS